jgi:hypothetical protein
MKYWLWVLLRFVGVVVVTWVLLLVLPLPMLLLSAHWQYYLISPASVALWLLSFLVAPIVTCVVTSRWILDGAWTRVLRPHE